MAKFAPENIEGISYDFTAFPKIGGGTCAGKGEIPEPSDEQVDAYLAAELESAKSAEAQAENDVMPTFVDLREKLTVAIEGLGVPRAHLEELPPRYFYRFRDWLSEELLPNAGRSDS